MARAWRVRPPCSPEGVAVHCLRAAAQQLPGMRACADACLPACLCACLGVLPAGVRKNFGVLRELMAELVEIRDNRPSSPEAAEAAGLPMGAAPAGAGGQAAAAVGAPAAVQGVLRQLGAAEQRLLLAAGPAAAWAQRRLAGSLPMPVSPQAGVVAVAVAVAAAILAVALRLKALLDAPLADYCATDGCIPGVGQFVCFLYSASHVVDMPDSLREVAGCVLLLTAAQHLGALLLAHLPLDGNATQQARPALLCPWQDPLPDYS